MAISTERPRRFGASWIAGLFDYLHERRNGLMMSPKFQRFASGFFLTRPIARYHASKVFDLCAGFVYSQILYAAIKLDLLKMLERGPRSLDTLARDMALPRERAHRFLDAAVALQLASRRGDEIYGLGQYGAAVLANPGILHMIEHHAMLYADLQDPVALLRNEGSETALSRYWAYARSSAPGALEEDDVARYTALMAQSQTLVADEILDAYDISQHRRALDIGGGDGTFLRAAARRAPHLKLTLFDLPPVAALAEAAFQRAGLSNRATAIGGSFHDGALPQGADLITLVRVIHDHDDAPVRRLLTAARLALKPGGTILIGEPLSHAPGAEAMGDAYFGFYLMAMGSGRPRTADEIFALLCEAGFSGAEEIPTRIPLQTSVIIARS